MDSWWIPGGFLAHPGLSWWIPGLSWWIPGTLSPFTRILPGIYQESTRTGSNQEEPILVGLAGASFLEDSSRNTWGSVKSSVLPKYCIRGILGAFHSLPHVCWGQLSFPWPDCLQCKQACHKWQVPAGLWQLFALLYLQQMSVKFWIIVNDRLAIMLLLGWLHGGWLDAFAMNPKNAAKVLNNS